MGFQMRKSIKLAPGVRMNFSKSGVGYSAGVKGYRVSKGADGRVRRTASIPGTGISHSSTVGRPRSSGSRRQIPSPPPPQPRPAKPSLLAPKGEKELYKALQTKDHHAMDRIGREHSGVAVAAYCLAGLLKMSAGELARAEELFETVFALGVEPADDPFVKKYVSASFTLGVAPGATAELRTRAVRR